MCACCINRCCPPHEVATDAHRSEGIALASRRQHTCFESQLLKKPQTRLYSKRFGARTASPPVLGPSLPADPVMIASFSGFEGAAAWYRITVLFYGFLRFFYAFLCPLARGLSRKLWSLGLCFYGLSGFLLELRFFMVFSLSWPTVCFGKLWSFGVLRAACPENYGLCVPRGLPIYDKYGLLRVLGSK